MQEIAFTLANGIAYVQAAIDAGLDVDEFAPRLSFFWNGHNNFFEEVAKFRAARRMWYRIMTERFGAQKEVEQLLRFHTQTGGSTLTAQQPENNIVRVAAAGAGRGARRHAEPAHQRLRRGARPADRGGGARSPCARSRSSATSRGVADTPDPLAGSYFVESLTDEVERLAWEYIERIDDDGRRGRGDRGRLPEDEIEQAAYEYTKSIDDGERVIVGVNKFRLDDEPEPTCFPIDPELERGQRERLARVQGRPRRRRAVDGPARRRARRGARARRTCCTR